jgi:hypothetical protein
VTGRIDTHHHVVPPFYARHQIDRGTADTLFPEFARSAP